MKKYKPNTKEELSELARDESIYLGDIDTGLITDMSWLFAWSGRKDFSGINEWDTSNVTDMTCMFWRCENFNEPLEFNTSNVTIMACMFWQCNNFNKPLKFDTSKVSDMRGMFDECDNLEAKNLHNFSKETMINDFYKVNGMANRIIEENWIKKLNGKYQPKNKAELKALVYTDGIDLDKIDTSLITDMSKLFEYSKRKDFSGINEWETSNVTDMSSMFSASLYLNIPLSFDTSNVTNMNNMLSSCEKFNQSLDFNTSKVKDMSFMFFGCKNFNQPLSFDTSKVTNMESMFYKCKSFNQQLNFDTKKVINFEQMFCGCKNFRQKVNFNMSNAIYTDNMFDYEYIHEPAYVNHSSFRKFILAIKRLPVKDFASIMHLYQSQFLKIVMLYVRFFNFFVSLNPSFGMYKKRGSYKPKTKEELEELVRDNNIYLGDIDTSLITDMSGLFMSGDRIDFNGIEKWDTSKVTNMSCMFADCIFFNQKLEWDTSKVTNMSCMFLGCINFNKPISFDIQGAKNTKDEFGYNMLCGMFKDCKKLEPKNLKNFSKDEVIENFYYLSKLPKFIAKNKWIDMENNKFKPKSKAELKALVYTDGIRLDKIDTSKISDMRGLFAFSPRKDFSGVDTWDTSNVTDMSYMFSDCENFNQELSFDTSNVTSMKGMFKWCESFNQPLNFDTSNVTDMDGMFYGCDSLEQLPEFYKRFCEENEG